MQVRIEKIDNGYILTVPHPTQDGELVYVLQIPDNMEENGKEYWQKIEEMIWVIMEGLDIRNSKHNKYRLETEIRKNTP